MDKVKGKILTETELQKRLKYWQDKLNLRDWKIVAKISRERHMTVPGRAGEINWVLVNKCASIRILDPIDFPEGIMIDQDMEKTLVHELLHIHFAPINDDHSESEHYSLFEEHAINAIADTLIDLERK